MKPLLVFPFLMLPIGIVPAAFGAALDSNEVFQVRSQASNSLAVFRTLVTPANYNLLGFHSTNEVIQATNAEALLIYTLGLDQLRNYHLGEVFDPLLEPDPRQNPARQVIVPIMVGTNVRSSTTLRFEPVAQGQWTNSNWGQPKLIRTLMATYRSIPSSQLSPGNVPFGVEIPVFDLWLVGYFNLQNQMVLRATVDLRLGSVNINRNQVVTKDAMYRLAIAAQRYNGFPN